MHLVPRRVQQGSHLPDDLFRLVVVVAVAAAAGGGVDLLVEEAGLPSNLAKRCPRKLLVKSIPVRVFHALFSAPYDIWREGLEHNLVFLELENHDLTAWIHWALVKSVGWVSNLRKGKTKFTLRRHLCSSLPFLQHRCPRPPVYQFPHS